MLSAFWPMDEEVITRGSIDSQTAKAHVARQRIP